MSAKHGSHAVLDHAVYQVMLCANHAVPDHEACRITLCRILLSAVGTFRELQIRRHIPVISVRSDLCQRRFDSGGA
jgi:hypothetical protein